MNHDICTLFTRLISNDNTDDHIIDEILEHVKKLPIRMPLWSKHMVPRHSINLEYDTVTMDCIHSIFHTWYDVHMVHYFETYTLDQKNRFEIFNAGRTKKQTYTYTIKISGHPVYFRPLDYITKCIHMFKDNPSIYKIIIDNDIGTPCFVIHNYRTISSNGVRSMSTLKCCHP